MSSIWESQSGSGGTTPTTYTYTNPTPMPTKVGGWLAGSTFSNVALDPLFTGILYEYLNPTFSGFSISGQTTPLEVGNEISAGSKTFTWTTTNSANVEPNTIEIVDVTGGNTSLASGLANDGSEAITIGAIQKTSATSHVFQIKGQNTNLVAMTVRNYTVNWQWRMYWGFLASTTISSAEILALGASKLGTSFNSTITLPTNSGTNYDFICYPDSWGLITRIYDNGSGFDLIGAYTDIGVVSHTNAFGVTEDYRIFRSTTASAGKTGWSYTIS